ncbi:MAG: hypothetical protein F6K23_39460, partial [Okeania sp. SIO2C9]|uniref:hypothetical protein n=1 Tax=Okeania sp. SIO2C9 TaxID=2607791 RepID=UPI0013BF04C9
MQPQPAFLLDDIDHTSFSDLICAWDFTHSQSHSELFTAQYGEHYQLRSASGTLQVITDQAAGRHGSALHLDEGQYLSIDRHSCPLLDRHGNDSVFSMLVRCRRAQKADDTYCEFIAGQWNESNEGGQYGLFINIKVWQVADRLFGHLSNSGGPTSGYKFCM